MDIASLSMAMSREKVMSQFGAGMLSKALDTADITGQGIVNMIDSAAMERMVMPEIGSNLDISI